jgi:hypothetical protein
MEEEKKPFPWWNLAAAFVLIGPFVIMLAAWTRTEWVSSEFERDSRYFFSFVEPYEIRSGFPRVEIEKTLARLDSEANTEKERAILAALSGYESFMDNGKTEHMKACKATYQLLIGNDAVAKFQYPGVTKQSCSDARDADIKEILASVKASQEQAAKEQLASIKASEAKEKLAEAEAKRARIRLANELRPPKVGIRCSDSVTTDCYDEQNLFHPKN